MPKINSLEVVHQDTNKDSYQNLHDILVEFGKYISTSTETIDGNARASIKEFVEVYADDKEAFARKVIELSAEFGDSIAKLMEELKVYASASEAYAKKTLLLEAELGRAKASLEEEKRARVTATEASASNILTLQAIFDKASARINQEMVVRANQDSALAYLITTLEATFTSALATTNASIVTEQTVRANADEALAQTITTLQSSFQGQINTTNAAISTEATTRANADTALSNTITTLSATVGSKNRTFYQTTAPTGSTGSPLVAGDLWIDSDGGDLLYRYSGSAWINIQDNQIGVNTAAISSEATTRATQDSALSTSINAVTTRLDTGDFATVKTQAEAGATKNKSYYQTTAPTGVLTGDLWFDTANGNKAYRYNGSTWAETTDTRLTSTYARWGVQVDANGNVAGLQLNSSSSGTSEFTVVANNFKVWGSGGAVSIQKPLDIAVSGSTQTVYLGNAMIVYYEGTTLNRWAAINNVKSSGVYARPTASDITTLPYSWASNGSAGFFAGNAGTGGNYHGLRGAAFTNNNDASVTSRGIVGSHTGSAFYAEIGGYAPFTGEHHCAIAKDTPIQEGQIVVDKQVLIRKDLSNTLCEIELATQPNQKGVIGVFLRNAGPMSKDSTFSVITEHTVDDGFGNLTGPLTEQYDAIKDSYDSVYVNALGEGQVLVCGENGNISKGDLIVTSSTAGIGMKQADDIIRGYTVAKAREDITFDDTTTPKLVACIYLCG